MKHYSAAAVERAMKLQEVIMRATAKEITWYQAAEIIGISCRQMRPWKGYWERHGYEGLLDRRRAKPSAKRVAVETLEEVLRLCREQNFNFNVRHFHEKLVEQHHMQLSCTSMAVIIVGFRMAVITTS